MAKLQEGSIITIEFIIGERSRMEDCRISPLSDSPGRCKIVTPDSDLGTALLGREYEEGEYVDEREYCPRNGAKARIVKIH